MFLKKISLYILTVLTFHLNSAQGSDGLKVKTDESAATSSTTTEVSSDSLLPESPLYDPIQQVKNVIKNNEGLVHHTASDILTVASRFIFPPLETITTPYRWISGCYMWYQNHQQLSLQPSFLLDIKNYAILAHLGVDIAEYMLASTPGLIELIPGGDYLEGTLNTVQLLSYIAILGSTGLIVKQSMTPSSPKDKKDA